MDTDRIARLVAQLRAQVSKMNARVLAEMYENPRGMCSRHLAENFERLAAAIRDACLDEGTVAIEYLDAARWSQANAELPPRNGRAGPTRRRRERRPGAAERTERAATGVS
ncbi:MAG TPA: hypothetical protein VFI53_19025 [Myxococcaceae bacterium]|nr:hypothetical protein [Myxococcaceae bacterium]